MLGNPQNDHNPLPKPLAIALICIIVILLSLFFFVHPNKQPPIPDGPPTLPALPSSLSLPDLLSASAWHQTQQVPDGPVGSYQFTPEGQYSHKLETYALPTQVTVGTWTLDGQTLILTPVKYDLINTGAPGTLVIPAAHPLEIPAPYPLRISDDFKTLTDENNIIFSQTTSRSGR